MSPSALLWLRGSDNLYEQHHHAGQNALSLDRFMDYVQSEQMYKDNRINVPYGYQSNTSFTDLAEDGRAKTLGLRDICGRVIL